MNPFVRFMQTPAGRISRIVAGLALIAGGLIGFGGSTGYFLAGSGVIPLAAGLLDICLMAPFFRVPWSGAKIRSMHTN
jgi:hypothetical protein